MGNLNSVNWSNEELVWGILKELRGFVPNSASDKSSYPSLSLSTRSTDAIRPPKLEPQPLEVEL